MKAQLLDGKKVADLRSKKISVHLNTIKQNGWHIPGLAVILIGNDTASHIYVSHKNAACHKLGIHSNSINLPTSTSQEELCELIDELNYSPNIDGILVQLPLPEHINPKIVFEKISPNKDVDGFHPYNMGNLIQNHPTIRPCTPLGIINLLEAYNLTNLTGLNAVVVGASDIVGKPMAFELLHKRCTVTLCHSATRNLPEHIKQADILVSAIGKPNIIQGEWIKKDSIVIDVGINRLENGSIIGDIDFLTAGEVASWITPVPGGVGPMTIITLIENTMHAANYLLRRYPKLLDL